MSAGDCGGCDGSGGLVVMADNGGGDTISVARRTAPSLFTVVTDRNLV